MRFVKQVYKRRRKKVDRTRKEKMILGAGCYYYAKENIKNYSDA